MHFPYEHRVKQLAVISFAVSVAVTIKPVISEQIQIALVRVSPMLAPEVVVTPVAV